METQTIHELLVEQEHLRGQIEQIKIQQAIFVSRFESEQGTEKRRHEGIDIDIDKANKRITDEIEKAEKQWNHIIFNRENGIAFIIDRLIEKDTSRQRQSKWIMGLMAGFILLVLERVFSYLTHKN